MLEAGVHKIRRDITLSCSRETAKNAWVQHELAARIKNYITQRIQGAMEKNSMGARYYKLSELLKGEKIVTSSR